MNERDHKAQQDIASSTKTQQTANSNQKQNKIIHRPASRPLGRSTTASCPLAAPSISLVPGSSLGAAG